MKKIFPVILTVLFSCGQVNQGESPELVRTLTSGHWLFTLDLGEVTLPVQAFYSEDNGEKEISFLNGEEVIKTQDISQRGDSIFMNLPLFGTILCGKIQSDSLISGFYMNPSKSKDYKIPMTAVYGLQESKSNTTEAFDFSGKWEVTLSPNSDSPDKAIGIFEQSDGKISGTFLTETGDYRYLQGKVEGNAMEMSCFDGAHVFMFRAEANPERELKGTFWSGNHYQTDWTALRNDDVELLHPDSITAILEDMPEFNHKFLDLNNKEVSISDERFKDKVLIIQIMGTWCPNCADESRDFVKIYNRYQEKGLEIIAVAYERTEDFEVAAQRIQKFKDDVGAEYTFVYAGKADKKENSKDFEMIDGITSYPTAIFVDRKGKIRKVHTGYYGPGTGNYHIKYLEETEMFLEKLLSEGVSS